MREQVSVAYTSRRTPRVIQIESLFDFSAKEKLERTWDVDLPIEDRDWQIGLIVGPSGAGKSTVARACFGDLMVGEFDWPDTEALVDCFPTEMGIKGVTSLLNAVGLSSVPSWLRPYATLSTGERFRAHVARALAENPQLAVVDEWTSTVDRQVATITSAAVAKIIRREPGRRLVAVGCHYDVEDWLQPDWVYQPHVPVFTWRSVQPRPRVEVDIRPVDRSVWSIFRPYHYLSGALHTNAKCYGAFVGDECVAFAGVAGFPHRSKEAQRIRRVRRLVVLPDWQGLGIGTRMEEWLAEFYCARGFRFRSVTAHPGLIRYYLRSPRWRVDTRAGQMTISSGKNANKSLADHQASARMLLTYAFEYMPAPK